MNMSIFQTKNDILIRRKNKILLESLNNDMGNRDSECSAAMVMAFAKNVESLGYYFDTNVVAEMLKVDKKIVKFLHNELFPILAKQVGADKQYHPMYPNFPEQVAEASDAELYVNAIFHYMTFGEWLPEYEKNPRFPLIDNNKTTILTLGNNEDLMEIFKNLVSSKTSLSQQDKDDVAYIIKNCLNYASYLPDEIPLKENVAFVGNLIISESPVDNVDAIQGYFKTATDVLRLITAMSDGDISLSENTKFRKLRRKERRAIMKLLSNCGNITEDMFRYRERWLRVGEIVHPSEFTKPTYQNVIEAFHTIRNDKKPLFFAGSVQESLKSGNVLLAVDKLKERPGEFARLLDKCLRDCATIKERSIVIDAFRSVVYKVSTPVLLQVREHFLYRTHKENSRVFFPKGSIANAIVIENDLPEIDSISCNSIVNICDSALVSQYATRESLGNVYISEDFWKMIVPFSQRNANSTGKSVIRGSRFKLNDNAKAVRGFIWWTNTNKGYSRVDIDLSAAYYDKDWNYINHVSYTRLRDGACKTYHSGDIVDGGDFDGNGVAEFIDFDIESVSKNGRYIVFQVHSFTGQKFSEIPNCRFGFMEREDVATGEIFEPKTVEMSIDVNSPVTTAIPVIFDLEDREFIWADMNVATTRVCNNVENTLNRTTEIYKAITNPCKPNMYELCFLNATARGNIVYSPEDADILFANDTDLKQSEDQTLVTAFDFDYIVSNLI